MTDHQPSLDRDTQVEDLAKRVRELEEALKRARPHIAEQFAALHIKTTHSEQARNIRIKVLGEVLADIDAALATRKEK